MMQRQCPAGFPQRSPSLTSEGQFEGKNNAGVRYSALNTEFCALEHEVLLYRVQSVHRKTRKFTVRCKMCCDHGGACTLCRVRVLYSIVLYPTQEEQVGAGGQLWTAGRKGGRAEHQLQDNDGARLHSFRRASSEEQQQERVGRIPQVRTGG